MTCGLAAAAAAAGMACDGMVSDTRVSMRGEQEGCVRPPVHPPGLRGQEQEEGAGSPAQPPAHPPGWQGQERTHSFEGLLLSVVEEEGKQQQQQEGRVS